jgi:hypothetical protein
MAIFSGLLASRGSQCAHTIGHLVAVVKWQCAGLQKGFYLRSNTVFCSLPAALQLAPAPDSGPIRRTRWANHPLVHSHP